MPPGLAAVAHQPECGWGGKIVIRLSSDVISPFVSSLFMGIRAHTRQT